VKAVRDQQPEKHSLPKVSTDAGIHMDCRDEQSENDLDPIAFKQEMPSNAIVERDAQARKHLSPRDSVDAGTVKDVIALPENALTGMIFGTDVAEMEEGGSIR
jgi:hypothetical protein